jgi:hypothetical protein
MRHRNGLYTHRGQDGRTFVIDPGGLNSWYPYPSWLLSAVPKGGVAAEGIYKVGHDSPLAPHPFDAYCMLEVYPSDYHSFEYSPAGAYKMVCS